MNNVIGALLVVICAGVTCCSEAPPSVADDIPRAHDSRLVVELFAQAPDIVHPVNIAFDRKGRLLVIESHTHFPPKDYTGPKHDRIRVLEDTNGDGKADKFTTFFEGTRASMDIATHPDGSIYLATRNEVLRLVDADGDGKADEHKRLIQLETTGNYPHNGLSGLAFDSKGNLFFGMGENLGVRYKLIGTDGETITDEGEGGNLFWCTADGKKLRRVATGFWNPFGVCTDIFGRVFAVDNDPDAMPPCRLLHIVEGGDYGYQFRYGRSGRHPFQAWNGQLFGTLPMVAGTGESPCEVVSYESDGLPREYLGDLLVTAWAEHRIERYVPKERGASVTAERQPFVQGGQNFRPVGLAVAPDGSLFVSDWVLPNYELHGRGAIWHVRMRDRGAVDRPTDPREAIKSLHRPLREAAAKKLAEEGEAGQTFLRKQKHSEELRVRATALIALGEGNVQGINLPGFARMAESTPLRTLVLKKLLDRLTKEVAFNNKPSETVRLQLALNGERGGELLLELATDDDPFIRHEAILQLSERPGFLAEVALNDFKNPRERMAVLLAYRLANHEEAPGIATRFLKDSDPDVRLLAAKWIADHRLPGCRPALLEAMKDPQLTAPLYLGLATALARLEGREVNEARLAELFFQRLSDPHSNRDVRIAALRLLPPTHKPLTVELLERLLAEKDEGLRLEAVRALCEHPEAKRYASLAGVASKSQNAVALRAEALVGLAGRGEAEFLIKHLEDEPAPIRAEVLRGLVQVKLTDAQRQAVSAVADKHPELSALAARVLGKPFRANRPKATDLAGWLRHLEGPADVEAGRRVFFHPKLAACSRCHRVDGRGQDVGPDLSAIGRSERKHILEAILQPSNLVAPHYQVWALETAAGKVHTGMLTRTHLDENSYIDAKGETFKLKSNDVVQSRLLSKSIMPDELVDVLTDQELRDLLAYLGSRR